VAKFRFLQIALSLMIGFACSARPVAGEDQPMISIEFIGEARVAGEDKDLSGQQRLLVNGEPSNRFGGISALEYTGAGNRFLALPDRGPDDGATEYECRLHVVDIAIEPGADAPVQVRLKQTLLFRDNAGRCFSGSSKVLTSTAESAGRLDPEGIRIGADGSLFVSDEYGPQLLQFDGQGTEVRRFTLPQHLQITHASADKATEIATNTQGRVSNRGMEGLALSSDGQKLVGIMQSCLLQDGEKNDRGWIVGNYTRIVEVTIATGEVREFAYPMEKATNGISEILACGPNQYLVLERDGEAGLAATSKKVFLADLSKATDIANHDRIPADQLPTGIQGATKALFLDLLSPQLPFAGESLPEKMEGLTFGPRLPDGRRTLVIAVDNDFESDFATRFWVFAMNGDALLSSR